MREFTNLQWPQTPFGADKRAFPHVVHLVSAAAVQWADHGNRAIPMAAAMVYLPVGRTGAQSFEPSTLHFGYRAVALEQEADAPQIAAVLDGHLVQARREAVAVAAHRYLHDARALGSWSSQPTAGITSVAEAWQDRDSIARGTALLVETSEDLRDQHSALPVTCRRHGLAVVEGTRGLLRPGEVQSAYDRIFAYGDAPASADAGEQSVQTLAHGAVCQALVVALLAAQNIGRGTWPRPFPVERVIENEAWDAFPHVLSETPQAAGAAG